MKLYILIEICCQHYIGIYTSIKEIAEVMDINYVDDETTRNQLSDGGYTIYEVDTETIKQEEK